jgi:lysylphosphatidylglycerol synthetase-like protein (DUF2156 family)
MKTSNRRFGNRTYMNYIIFSGAVTAIAVLLLLPLDVGLSLTNEGGLIENVSLAVLAAGAVCAGLKLWRCRTLLWASIALLIFWMYLRELDYQKLFTPRSIESTGFYFSSRVPLNMKIAAAAALCPFILAALNLVAAAARSIKAFGRPSPAWTAPIGFAAILLGAALFAEKFLPPRFQVVEETAELAFASLILFGVIRAVGARDEKSLVGGLNLAQQTPGREVLQKVQTTKEQQVLQ